MPSIVDDYLAKKILFKIRPISRNALAKAESIAHFSADSVSPKHAAMKIIHPVLIAHGTKDKHISIDYGKTVYDHLQSKDKRWYPIEGANHYNLWEIGGEEYKTTVLNFLSEYLKSD